MAKKILIVDDEPDFVSMLEMRLRSYDYEVVVARNGGEGLERYCREKPDALILDIMMPVVDGIELLKRIRKFNRHIPVFIISALLDPETIQQLRDLKISGFFLKTSDIRKGIEDIISCLKGRS